MGKDWREMAERTTILRAPVGSTIHGLHVEGTDDRDEMGVCVEDLDAFMGWTELDGEGNAVTRVFEQYISRTATERTGRVDARSEPGDLDLCVYSLRKFARLALQGNPTVLALLFVPWADATVQNALGAQLRELAPAIVSRQAGPRYLGYMASQMRGFLGEKGTDVHRPELVARHGYDTKYAAHMLRLGFQGQELLTYGRLTLPMPETVRALLMRVRTGATSYNEVAQLGRNLQEDLAATAEASPLPEHPDYARVEGWVRRTYLEHWKAMDFDASIAAMLVAGHGG